MRISDWSSDVCSSDLHQGAVAPDDHAGAPDAARRKRARPRFPADCGGSGRGCAPDTRPGRADRAYPPGLGRSEEHKSELQSLMRISYAVFCLKTKKQTTSLASIICNYYEHTCRQKHTQDKQKTNL